MSKSVKERHQATRTAISEESSLIPAKYQHPAAILLLVLSLVIFFHEMIFQGKTYLSVDSIASHSWDTIVKEANASGTFPLWNPYIFCGFPGYASLSFGGSRLFDISGLFIGYGATLCQYLFLNAPGAWVLAYYITFAAGMYFFIYRKVRHKLAALLGAFGATYSMYIIIWMMVTHTTKIAVMAFFPFVFLLLEKLRDRFSWKWGVVLVFLIHFMFLAGHVQMIFYAYLAIGIYLLFFFVRGLLKKTDWKNILRVGVVLGVATVLALCMDADKYLSVLEYTPYSMRGMGPIVQTPSESSTAGGGLAYDYATAWSFGVGELATFVSPWWYGFGQSVTYDGVLTNNQPRRLPLYFGPQNFVDGPQYMGIVILVLAIVGFAKNRKEPFVQFSAIVVLVSILLSFGKELPLLFDPMFKYFPYFNRLRIPSMILVLAQVFVPVLAAYGVVSLLGVRNQAIPPSAERRWKYVLAGLAGLFLVALLAPAVYKSVYATFVPLQDAAARYAPMVGNNQRALSLLYDFVADKVAMDFVFGFGFLLLVFGAFYRYIHQKLGVAVLGTVLVIVVVADLWRVDYVPNEPRDFAEQTNIFTAPDYVRYLQQDTTLFRVLVFRDGHPPYDNTLAYWKIQSAYGYQGAKMRWFQDIDDVVGMGNPLVWQLMNVKYIISNTPDSSQILGLVYNGPDYKVYLNRAYAPRAFFVNRYEVAQPLDILNKMKSLSFNVQDVAYTTDDPKLTIQPPREGATAEYTRYGLQDFELHVNATGNNLLFLSESYYPKGWNAYLDGSQTPVYRLDYLFRGVVIPPGAHTLHMKFEPTGFAVGKNLSFGMNILLLGALGFAGYDWWRKKRASGARTGEEQKESPASPVPSNSPEHP